MDKYCALFVCSVVPMPADLATSFAEMAEDLIVYMATYVIHSSICHCLLGLTGCIWMLVWNYVVTGSRLDPPEFHITGTLKEGTIIDDIYKITVPTLFLNGR